ncbi:MAG TPA: MipA/OmpV family protein, partial [Rhodopila sp.]|nr:MipA/OmpV family protein [Rhodopila sp.]
YRDIAFASMGEGLGVNVLRGKNYRVGFAIGYDLGRQVSDYPSHLRGLGDIGAAPTFKLFADYAIAKSFPAVLRVDIRGIIGGADGVTGDLSAYMPLPGSSRKLIMFAGPSLSFAGAGYMQNVFGLNPTQARLSGFQPFSTHGGPKSLGFGFSATWFVAEHWLFNTDMAVERLLGGAATSPITQEKVQGTVSVSFAYRW